MVMKAGYYSRITYLSLFTILFFIACGGPPQNNPLLTEAEEAYSKAERDSLIVLKAPVALKEAEENLEKGQEIWEAKGDTELIEHYAYIAKQKTAIAEETAKLNEAQDKVERAEAERKEVLLTARKAEAEAAERKAQQALAELEAAKEEARNAQKRAEEMANRLTEMEASTTERGLVLTLSDVLFDFNSAELKPGAKKIIEELKSFLQEYPQRKILIEGHTDSVGSEEYNMGLSLERANALRMALISAGVSPQKIETAAYGEQYPVATNINEAGRQQNRRVEIVVSDSEGILTARSK